MAVERDPGVSRVSNFSDAVVAIAITLLVLPLSAISATEYHNDFVAMVSGNTSKFAAFFLSFWVLSFFWLAHYHLFRRLTRLDNTMLGLNLVWLLVVAFIPFPTYLLGSDTFDGMSYAVSQSALLLYIGTDLVGWVLKTWMQHHAVRAGLVITEGPDDARKVEMVGRRNVVITVGIAVVFVLAVVLPSLAEWALVLLLLAVPLAWLVEWAIHRRESARAR